MTIAKHTCIAAVVASPMIFWSKLGAVIFIISSVMLDFDHFVFYSLHERKIIWSPQDIITRYEEWDYYGPRIHFFHNYETILLTMLSAWFVGGFFWYLLGGIFLHLFCDQLHTYYVFRIFRIRSFVGDILRYKEYLSEVRQGRKKEYMINLRDSWWNHLRVSFSARHFKLLNGRCGILKMYPGVPIDKSNGNGPWQKFL